MLKKIQTSELGLGMHLHSFEGSWLDHPFWRAKFVLTEEADLRAIRKSGILQCWIDSSKGTDVAPGPAETRLPAATAPETPVSTPRAAPAPLEVAVPAPSVSFEDELQAASRLCEKSKQVVQHLFGELRLGNALNAEACRPLVEELSDSVFRNPEALVSLARLKTRDDYSYMHSVAVCALMIALGRQLGLGIDACREAGLAGLLHDVGKALMPLDVLNKPGKLTDAEFAIMRSHPQRGHELLTMNGNAGAVALDVCLHHHERVDGSGYPFGLPGAELSQMARMGAICDVYDAVSSTRPYKQAWDPADAIAKMATWTGHFDPPLFAAFVRSLGIYPTGSLVRLRSGRLAVVVRQNEGDLTKPTLKAFFSTKAMLPIPVVRVDLARKDASDAIVGREPNQDWNFQNLDLLWMGSVQ